MLTLIQLINYLIQYLMLDIPTTFGYIIHYELFMSYDVIVGMFQAFKIYVTFSYFVEI